MPRLAIIPEPEFAWDRQPGESEVAHTAFLLYRDQPPGERSYREVAQACGKNPSLMQRWSATHEWTRRVAAWDRHVDRQRQARIITEVGEMAARHVQLAIGMQQKALEKLLTLDVDAMSPGDLNSFVRTATMVEREARGILTSREDADEEAQGRENDLDDRITELVTKRRQAIAVQSHELPPAEEA